MAVYRQRLFPFLQLLKSRGSQSQNGCHSSDIMFILCRERRREGSRPSESCQGSLALVGLPTVGSREPVCQVCAVTRPAAFPALSTKDAAACLPGLSGSGPWVASRPGHPSCNLGTGNLCAVYTWAFQGGRGNSGRR